MNALYLLLVLSYYYRSFYDSNFIKSLLTEFEFMVDAILRGSSSAIIDTSFNVRSHQKRFKQFFGGSLYPIALAILDAFRTNVVRDPNVRKYSGDSIFRNTSSSCLRKDRDKSIMTISIGNLDDLWKYIMPCIKLHYGPCSLLSLGSYYFQIMLHQLVYLRSFYTAKDKDFILIPDDTFLYTIPTFAGAWGLYDYANRNKIDDKQKTLYAEWCIGLVYEQLQAIDNIHIEYKDEDMTTIEELEIIEINKLISIFRGISMFYYYLKLSENIQAGIKVESSETKIKNLFEALNLGFKNQCSLKGIIAKYSSKKDICRILTEFSNRNI